MSKTATLTVNGEQKTVTADAETPLLWVLRDLLGMTGTKFGCGQGLCGACTVHVDGVATRSCQVTLGDVEGAITTIEGLGGPENLHAVQAAWVAVQAPQCGYCQSGQIMTAAALLAETPNPTDEDIAAAMDGVICRCGSYPRIKAAIRLAASGERLGQAEERRDG